MTVKLTGAQFKGFLDHVRDEGLEIEGAKLKVNERPADVRHARDGVMDTDRIELKGGIIGSEDLPGGGKAEHVARKWLLEQTHVTLTAQVPREEALEIQAYLRARGIGASIHGM